MILDPAAVGEPEPTAPEAVEAPAPVADAMEIVSTVSHELRSPLTSIKGFTSLLLNRWDRLPDSEKRMLLEQVNHDADRVTRLVGELLDISRLQTGRLNLSCQEIDIGALAAAVIDRVGIEYASLDAELSVPDGAAMVWADADKVEQVLTNLVENSCKYADPTQVSVKVFAADPEQRVVVCVDDHGEGIPPADLPHVFDQFFQRDHGYGRPTGTGLGLWISRGLVEAHGGRIWARSQVGYGSTFCFSLPVAPLPAAASRN